jgi:hypothetical protein
VEELLVFEPALGPVGGVPRCTAAVDARLSRAYAQGTGGADKLTVSQRECLRASLFHECLPLVASGGMLRGTVSAHQVRQVAAAAGELRQAHCQPKEPEVGVVLEALSKLPWAFDPFAG